MSTSSTLAALAALATLALAGTATAQTIPSAQSQQEVQVSGPALRTVTDREYEQVKGRYGMSDGRTLRVHRRGLRVWASLDGLESQVMRAAAPQHLVSADGTMQLHFSGDENVSHVRLVVDRRLAQKAPRVAAGDNVGTWTLTSVSPRN